MKTLAKIVLAAAAGLGILESPAMADDPQIKLSVETAVKCVKPTKSSIPEKVKAEAKNPTLYSPWTGNTWDGSDIGSYNPSQNDVAWDLGVSAKYTPDVGDFPIVPYAKLTLKYSFGPEKGGEYGWDYTHDVDMRGATPSEWVLYLYDVERKVFPLEPEAGLIFRFEDTPEFFVGASLEHVTYKYYKGIEAFGEPDLEHLGSSRKNTYNLKAGINVFGSDTLEIILGAQAAFGGERGYGGFISLGSRF
jgi:hypothetical protein